MFNSPSIVVWLIPWKNVDIQATPEIFPPNLWAARAKFKEIESLAGLAPIRPTGGLKINLDWRLAPGEWIGPRRAPWGPGERPRDAREAPRKTQGDEERKKKEKRNIEYLWLPSCQGECCISKHFEYNMYIYALVHTTDDCHYAVVGFQM